MSHLANTLNLIAAQAGLTRVIAKFNPKFAIAQLVNLYASIVTQAKGSKIEQQSAAKLPKHLKNAAPTVVAIEQKLQPLQGELRE